MSIITGEVSEMARLAKEATLGAGYIDSSAFNNVPNNAMAIGKEISKLDSDISEEDATDAVLKTMEWFKISATEAGRLVAAVGGEFDKKAMTTIRDNNLKLERTYKVNEISSLEKSINKLGEEILELEKRRKKLFANSNSLMNTAKREKLADSVDTEIHKKFIELEKQKAELKKIYEGLAIQE